VTTSAAGRSERSLRKLGLSSWELEVLRLYVVEKENVTQIARWRGVAHFVVSRALGSVRRKLKGLGLSIVEPEATNRDDWRRVCRQFHINQWIR